MVEMIETMREIVSAYDKLEAKKNAVKARTKALVKGGTEMKLSTVIAIAVGAIIVFAAGIAAVCLFTKKAGKCCCKKKKEDETLYDDFPEEEIITDSDETAPVEESAE